MQPLPEVKDDSPKRDRSKIPEGILPYLVKLEDDTLKRLYSDAFTSLTVFRSLSSLAKQYVMRMLYINEAVETDIIGKWVRQDFSEDHRAAVHRLTELRLIEKVDLANGQPAVLLNHAFRICLQSSLAGNVQQEFQGPTKRDKHPPTDADLDDNARNKWEKMFYYMVGHRQDPPPGPVLEIMRTVGLLQHNPHRNTDVATSKGYQFLFQPIHTQIWTILLAYMDGLEDRKMNRDEVLTFLFRLSFLEFGKACPKEGLSPTQKALVGDLAIFGLVHQYKSKSKVFYPTRLSTYLSSGAFETREERNRAGFLVVETAFKVYAYTTSLLRLSLLKLFVRLDVRLPNLVSGVITKRSVTEAFKKGINADQINAYLEQYAHARLRENTPVIPVNITDQIELWQRQRNRLEYQEATQLSNFTDRAEFDETFKFIQNSAAEHEDSKVIVYDEKNFEWMIVTAKSRELLKEFRKRKKQIELERASLRGGGFVS